MYFILKNASFPTTIGTITVQEGQVGGGGGSSTPTDVTFTINPTPSTATVVLTASGYTQSGNSITVLKGTQVSYTVSASGYTSKSGSKTVSYTQSLGVTLVSDGSGSGGTTPSDPVTPPSGGTTIEYSEVIYTLKDGYIKEDGTFSATSVSSSKWKSTDYIAVTAGDIYRYIGTGVANSANGYPSVHGYNSDKTTSQVLVAKGDYTSGIEFIIPDGVSYIAAMWFNADSNFNEASIAKQVIIQEGVPTVVETTITHAYIVVDGTVTDTNSAKWFTSDYIPVTTGEYYKYTGICESSAATVDLSAVHGFNSSKESVGSLISKGSYADGIIFTIPSGVSYIRYMAFSESGTDFKLEKYV